MPSLLSPKKIELASLAFFRLASCCEAVLEGMGSVWDKAADVRRHPVFAESAKEAVIAWGAPQAYMPEAKSFSFGPCGRNSGMTGKSISHTQMSGNDRPSGKVAAK